MVKADGSINGAANGSSPLPTNGAARAALDAIQGTKAVSKSGVYQG